MTKRMVQNEKLLMEKLPENYLPRHHIIQQLNNANQQRLIFFQAPGGYGKTSSTIHWLQQQKHQVLWVSLDEYDNLPTLFYKLCGQALLTVQPDNEPLANIINHPDFAASPVEFMILALSTLEPQAEPYTIVLDDFHFITNPKILKSLPFVLKRLSLSTKVILLSRAELPNEIKQYYNADKLLTINKKELAFTKNEIFSFYQQVGKKTAGDELALIFEQTKGWPIAIQSMATTTNPLKLVETPSQQLANYIEQQIWEMWSQETQEFLMKISPVTEVTIEIAELLTGSPNSQEFLADISSQSALLHQTEENSYRFHNLFQTFVLEKLANNPVIKASDLYKKLTTYYISMGNISLARQTAIKSQDEELMIISLTTGSSYETHKISMEHYVDTLLKSQAENLPMTIFAKEPVFHLIPAWYYFLTGQANKMAIHLDQLISNFEVINQQSPNFIDEIVLVLGLDPRQTLLNKVMAISSIINLPERGAVPVEQKKAISLTLQLPFLHRGILDYSELAEESVFLAVSPHIEVLLQDQAEATLNCVYGGLQLERNQLAAASPYIYQAYAALNEESVEEFYFSVSMHLLQLHYLKGETSHYLELKKDISQWIEQTNNYYLSPNFLAYTTRTSLWDGEEQQAQEWLDSYYVTQVTTIELYKLYQHFTTIRAHILVDNYHNALILAEKVLSFSQAYHRPADEVEALVLLTIIYWRLGNQKQALKLLNSAINKAQLFHFIRLFADEGAALLPALKKLKNHLNQLPSDISGFQTYLAEIYVACSQVSQKKAGILPQQLAETIRLSKQQLKMVELLAEGYKFAEMVDLTNLSINTIRTHISLAYQKLGANNATEAVIKAKELKLIK